MEMAQVVTLIVGLFGGGTLLKIIESIFDRKSGLKRLESEMQAGFKRTNERIENIQGAFDQHKAVMARVRILRFSDDVVVKKKHSKESFYQVLSDIDEYEDYCALNPRFENNKTVIATKRIKDVYKTCLEENSFL